MAASVRYVDSDGFTTLFVENWPSIFAGANVQPRKFALENNGTRSLGASPGPANGFQLAIQQIGANDGASEVRIIADTATLSPPWNLVTSVVADAGTFGATGTYGYKVTATNATGETIGCFEATATLAATTQNVILTWTKPTGATGFKIYRTTTPGTYGASTFVASVGNTNTYTDTGTATSAGTPPSINSSGDWVQTAPADGGAGGTFTATPFFWTIVAYDSTGVLLAISRESTFTPTLNHKVNLAWPAVFGASTYNVYRTASSGSYPSPSLVTSGVVGTSFVDTGAATTTGALTNPQSTVLQSFGFAPGTFVGQTNPLTVFGGSQPVGSQFFFWANRIAPGGTSESGNPRTANLLAQEF